MFNILLLLALLLVPAHAYAYLDPGTGSMIIQLVLAGVAGVGVAGKLFWRRILAFFQGTPKAPSTPGHDH